MSSSPKKKINARPGSEPEVQKGRRMSRSRPGVIESAGKPKKNAYQVSLEAKKNWLFLDSNQAQLRLLFAWTNPELNRGPHPDSEGAKGASYH